MNKKIWNNIINILENAEEKIPVDVACKNLINILINGNGKDDLLPIDEMNKVALAALREKYLSRDNLAAFGTLTSVICNIQAKQAFGKRRSLI